MSPNSIISLKYQRSTPSGGKVLGIGKSEFVAKTQFLQTAVNSKHSDFLNHNIGNLMA